MAKGRRGRSRSHNRRRRMSRPKSASAILNKAVSRCRKAKTRKVCSRAIATATNQLYHNRRVLKKLGVKRESRSGGRRRKSRSSGGGSQSALGAFGF